MAHGGYDKKRVAGRKPLNKGTNHRPKSLAVEKKPKAKLGSLKRQIRSTERLLRKDTRAEVKEGLTKKLQGLKSEQETQDNLALERKILLRDKKIKFFERRKVERNIRRLEKQQHESSGQTQEAEQLSKLKEDLEYIKFFPRTEKYISLFKKDDNDNTNTVDKRNSLRTKIKANIAAAVAIGKDLEETGSDDDFFLSDEVDADDELTVKSAREGKAASNDERARARITPPRASNAANIKSTYKSSSYSHSHSNTNINRRGCDMSSSSGPPSYRNPRPVGPPHPHTQTQTGGNGNGNISNYLSTNSDAHKPKRKRRPKKKKQEA